MIEFYDLVGEHIIIEYAPKQQPLYYQVNKIEDKKIYLLIRRNFEKTGLVINDIIKCRIPKEDLEYYFKAKILDIESDSEGPKLVITPISNIEEFYNIRSEKRIDYRLVAYADNLLSSIVNISKSGILLSTKSTYEIGDNINIKLLLAFPRLECNFLGTVVRIRTSNETDKEYGIKIIKFNSEDEQQQYQEFINELENRYSI